MTLPRLSPVVWVSVAVLAALGFAALFGPWLAPFAVDGAHLDAPLLPPDATHWLGTDEDGADLLTLLLLGARVAMVVGFGTVLVSGLIGTAIGGISGYRGGWIDEGLMRLVEVVQSFPGILLAILIIFLTEDPSQGTVIFALSATGWAGYARLVRGQVLSLREREFVLALRGLGASDVRILWLHIVPNAAGPLAVQATFGVAGAILAEASLSFLGLGAQDSKSWGALLDQGAVLFVKTPYVAMFTGILLAVSVLAVNLVGDALRHQIRG